LALLPRDSDALFNLGTILSSKGMHNAAIDAYAASAEVNPNDVELLYNLGVKFGERNDRVNEIEAYERALKVQPQFTKASLNLGAAFADIGDDIKAETHWLTAAVNPDTCKPALQNLAMLYEQRAAKAIRSLNSATTKDQAIAIAINTDAILASAQSTIERIIYEFSDSTWSSRLLRVLKTRGRVIAVSDIEQAITHLLKATELDSSDASVWLALKQAYTLTGNTVKASHAYEMASKCAAPSH